MHFHKWTNWSKQFWRPYADVEGGEYFQTRYCTKCNAIQSRRVY